LLQLGAGLLSVVLLATPVTGCFGRFELTRKIYRFNQTIDNDKWIQWLSFLVLNIIPVYGMSMLIDLLFANSVQFWTGSNPVACNGSDHLIVRSPNGILAEAWRLEEKAFKLQVAGGNGTVHTVFLCREAASIAAYTQTGTLIARVVDGGGQPRLSNNSMNYLVASFGEFTPK